MPTILLDCTEDYTKLTGHELYIIHKYIWLNGDQVGVEAVGLKKKQ